MLQVRGPFEDDSKIMFLIHYLMKTCCDPSLELAETVLMSDNSTFIYGEHPCCYRLSAALVAGLFHCTASPVFWIRL